MSDSTIPEVHTEGIQRPAALPAASPSKKDSSAFVKTPQPDGGAIIAPDDLITQARSMSDEELGAYIGRESKAICTKLTRLGPFIRVAFARIDDGKPICGHKSKKAFCVAVIGRSYNAVKFMLDGGNPQNTKRKSKPLTELEFKLLETATNVHEALTDLKAGRVSEAISKLSHNLPTQKRIEEHLGRGVAPTVINPTGRANSPVAKSSSSQTLSEPSDSHFEEDEDLFALLCVQLAMLKTELASEPDLSVASRMLTSYLESVASNLTSPKIKISRVSANVNFNGRSHRIVPQDYLKRRTTNSDQWHLYKCTAVTERTERRKVSLWSDGAWHKERVIYEDELDQYRVITEDSARLLAPAAFVRTKKSRAKSEKDTGKSLNETYRGTNLLREGLPDGQRA